MIYAHEAAEISALSTVEIGKHLAEVEVAIKHNAALGSRKANLNHLCNHEVFRLEQSYYTQPMFNPVQQEIAGALRKHGYTVEIVKDRVRAKQIDDNDPEFINTYYFQVRW